MHFEISARDFCYLLENEVIITESKQGIIKGIPYRVDPPNAYANQQKHVHIGDYTWNLDGSRSHQSRWPNAEPSKKIRAVAAQALNVNMSILEQYLDATVVITPQQSEKTVQLLLEGASIFGKSLPN